MPQGSILGPLLFLLYINDIINVSNILIPIIFADDTNIFTTGKSINDVIEAMNEELKKVVIWLNANKLSLNVRKTHYMIFHGKNRKIETNHSIQINSELIERVDSTKFIGVIMDTKLNWQLHIQHIRNKIAKGLGVICKARKVLNRETLIVLYNSIIYPYLTYCIEVWGSTAHTHLSSLIRMQKKIIRVLTSSKYNAESYPLFRQLNLLNVQEIYMYSTVSFMFKFIKGNLPEIFNLLFKRNSEIRRRYTRQMHMLNLPICQTTLYKNTIIFQGPKAWNAISNKININCSIHAFKRQLKRYRPILEHGINNFIQYN